MTKRITFAKFRTEIGAVFSGRHKPGVLEQTDSDGNGYSLVNKKQAASIKTKIDAGKFLTLNDIYHFNDAHVGLIQHAITKALLGNPQLPISINSNHVRDLMTAMIRHHYDFGNSMLAYILLVNLLTINGVNRHFVDSFCRNYLGFFGSNADAVAEIEESYRSTMIIVLNGELQTSLASKPASKTDSKRPKI